MRLATLVMVAVTLLMGAHVASAAPTIGLAGIGGLETDQSAVEKAHWRRKRFYVYRYRPRYYGYYGFYRPYYYYSYYPRYHRPYRRSGVWIGFRL